MSLAMRSVSLRTCPAHAPRRGYRLGLHFSERRDLRYGVDAVFLAHILDHAVTLVFAEVNVDIGQADTFDIQEAFKNEVIRQGDQGL